MTDLQVLAMRLFYARESAQRRLALLTAADNHIDELTRYLRLSFGLPAAATDAELDAAMAAELERLLGPRGDQG